MQPFGVLDRYIGKTIFTTIMMTLFMLVSLSGIIKFVDQLKKAGQGSYDALGAGMYTLLSVPKDVQIDPKRQAKQHSQGRNFQA